MTEPRAASAASVATSWAGVVVLAGAYAALAWSLRHGVDDAYIIYTYAKHLARGDGLVFNPGERVEGFTCFSWTLLLGGVRAMGLDLERTAPVLGLLLGVGTIPASYGLARAVGAGRRAALAAPALIVATVALPYWTATGMETAPTAALVAAVAWYYLRRPESPVVSGLLALAVMTRPDAIILAAALGVERALHWRDHRTFLRWVAPFVVVFGPYFTWRWAYYGYPLPNTFYAKVTLGARSLGQGWEYLASHLFAGGAIALVLLAAIAVASVHRSTVRAVAAAAGGYWVYAVAVGGDFLGMDRLVAPALPLWAALAATGLHVLVTVPGPRRRRVVGTVLAVAALAVVARRLPPRLAEARKIGGQSDYMVEADRFRVNQLGPYCDSSVTIATLGIGLLGYATECRIIDMLGLVDEHIAHEGEEWDESIVGHERHDSDYVLDRRPDILLVPGRLSPAWKLIPALAHLWANPRFKHEYQWDEQLLVYRPRDAR